MKAPNASCGLEKAGRGQSDSRLTDHQRCDQWASRVGILFDQVFEAYRKLVDRIWRRSFKGLREKLIRNG